MNQNMDEPLDYQDIGTLLKEKGKRLESGEGNPEDTIRDVLETIARARSMRARHKKVDLNGRVSVGRDLEGDKGLTLFHPDAGFGQRADEGVEDGER